MKALEVDPDRYPHAILQLQIRMYFAPFPFPLLGDWALPWRTDYAIRRVEFDHWLLQHSDAAFKVHPVRTISKTDEYFDIDGVYQCRYLVAGSTGCPVKRTFFPQQRLKKLQTSTIEKEFEYPQRSPIAHLFFAFHGLKGYAWYVPKGNGFLNLGLGGISTYFKSSGFSLRSHFQWFLEDLVSR